MNKRARASVIPRRQTNQYNCMSTSLMMCLQANGVPAEECTIEKVNAVMGAMPMVGASWEQSFAAAQHFGMRVHLICPATLNQVKEFTDRGIPVMIAWNPEGRPWGHASVIFDVDADLTCSIADPNIPDPEQLVRIVPKDEMYHKWFEKSPQEYLIRRPAMAVEREISPEGRQMVASGSKPLTISQSETAWAYTSAIQDLYRALTQIKGIDNTARQMALAQPDSKFADFYKVINSTRAFPHQTMNLDFYTQNAASWWDHAQTAAGRLPSWDACLDWNAEDGQHRVCASSLAQPLRTQRDYGAVDDTVEEKVATRYLKGRK